VDVLHLTDLHVTEPGETLETLWPREMLEGRQFDAIIVSGDLTQRADLQEYEELLQFSEKYLIPLLRPEKREAGRVVFTPGNHDVSWAAEVGVLENLGLALSSGQRQARQRLIDDFEAYKRNPAGSSLRIEFSTPGRFSLYRVEPDSALYRERFRNCQRFLNRFYAQPGLKRFKAFNLLHVGDDWSAHLFEEEQVAIFGFNSCHGNDRRWPVARIDHRAIANAATFRQEKCQNYLAVAVWHHGFTAEHGRPDFLSLADLGRLQDAGFRVGFHGHVHASAVWMLKHLRDDFALVATGSLGAGSADRPDPVGQQFSVVQLYPSRITVDVFERNQPMGKQYQLNERASRRLYLGGPGAGEERGNRIAEHERTWTVRESGILDAKVEMRGVSTEGNFILGVIEPPYSAFSYDDLAITDGQSARVVADQEPEGRWRFVMIGPKPRYQYLSWSYSMSNAAVMNQADLKLLEPVQRWHPNVPAGFDFRPHTLRHECDKLRLKLEFSEVKHGPQSAVAEARALVESRRNDEPWEVVKEEQQRCAVKLSEDGRVVELEVSAPVVGMRYSIVFRPKLPGTAIPPQALHLSSNVLRRCREPQKENELARDLTNALQETLYSEVLTGNEEDVPRWNGDLDLLGEGGAWLGLLWNNEERRLLPAFGRFRLESWGSRFAAGNGVAGYAFRRSGTAAWFEGKERSNLLYQSEVEPARSAIRSAVVKPKVLEPRYKWIVCIPIYLEPKKTAAIGVVSFAGREPNTPVARRLEQFAYRLVHEPEATEVLDFMEHLETVITYSFWTVIRWSQDLERADREVAKHFERRTGILLLKREP